MSAAFGGMYKVMLLLHLAAVVAAFAPLIIHPLLGAQAKADGSTTKLAGYMAANTRRVHFPALILAGVFGLGMIFSSDPGSGDNVWGFDQTWVSLALLVWIGVFGVVSGLIRPAQRKYALGDPDTAPTGPRGRPL